MKDLKKSKLEAQLDRQSYGKKIINVDKPQEVQRTTRKSSKSRRWREEYSAAAHEAAHAVTTIALGGQLKNRGIVLREDRGITYVQHPVLRRRNSANQWEYHPGSMRQVCRARLVSAFAGPIAENRISNDQTGIMGDVRNAVMNLRILFQGNDHLVEACNFKKYSLQFAIVMHFLVLTPSTEGAMEALDIVNGCELIDQKIVRMLVRSARCAHLIVERNWPTIEKLATALLPKSGMSGKEIREIVSKELLRDPISRRTILKVFQFVGKDLLKSLACRQVLEARNAESSRRERAKRGQTRKTNVDPQELSPLGPGSAAKPRTRKERALARWRDVFEPPLTP